MAMNGLERDAMRNLVLSELGLSACTLKVSVYCRIFLPNPAVHWKKPRS
jgi:hypothetical protein